MLRDAGVDETVSNEVVSAFREAIELQLRLVESEISKYL